jgi:CRP-like cAMP-binding protein
MSQNAIFERLKSFRVFQDLSDEEIKKVVPVLSFRLAPRGQELIKQDERTSEVFFIINGRVRIEIQRVERSGAEEIVTLGSGETVGELALAREGRRTASAIVQMEAELASVEAKALLDLFKVEPTIGMKVFRNLTQILANRLSDTNIMLRNAMGS